MPIPNFLKDIQNWNNHRPLIYWALQETKGLTEPILEMGCGEGSTPYLIEFCKKNKRQLISYDYDKEWADKYNAIHVTDWDSINHEYYSVILIDHSPGERRYIDIEKLKDKCEYMIIHDSEPAAYGYMLDKIWHLFPYRRNLITDGAWATIVSIKNEIPEINIKGFNIK
jgi:hypothetical protein